MFPCADNVCRRIYRQTDQQFSMLKRLMHVPVVVDLSHGTGHAWMVRRLTCAAIAAGTGRLLVEVHC